MADAYKSFNRPTGKPMKVAGGSAFQKQTMKSVYHGNESGTPGQNAGAMAPMGKSSKWLGTSAATDTGTVRKAK
jgi:hypothetical protein